MLIPLFIVYCKLKGNIIVDILKVKPQLQSYFIIQIVYNLLC